MRSLSTVSVTGTFTLLLLASVAATSDWRCPSKSACPSTMSCDPNSDCNVDCYGSTSCNNATVVCPPAHVCVVDCSGTGSCLGLTVVSKPGCCYHGVNVVCTGPESCTDVRLTEDCAYANCQIKCIGKDTCAGCRCHASGHSGCPKQCSALENPLLSDGLV